jgi:hypothetical protein
VAFSFSFFSMFSRLFLLFLIAQTFCIPTPNYLTVHVVPHSHCDPGWWYTFEEYHAKWTEGILNSVYNTLNSHDHRKVRARYLFYKVYMG